MDPRDYKLGTRLSSAMKNWPLWSLFAVAFTTGLALAVTRQRSQIGVRDTSLIAMFGARA